MHPKQRQRRSPRSKVDGEVSLKKTKRSEKYTRCETRLRLLPSSYSIEFNDKGGTIYVFTSGSSWTAAGKRGRGTDQSTGRCGTVGGKFCDRGRVAVHLGEPCE